MVWFWKKAHIEFRFKPISDFSYPKQWFFSKSYWNDDKGKGFYFTVIGLHFYYRKKALISQLDDDKRFEGNENVKKF
jgi:hypothetical protein